MANSTVVSLCPISEQRWQHAHYKELVIKQEKHLWNSWHFITCQKCWHTEISQSKKLPWRSTLSLLPQGSWELRLEASLPNADTKLMGVPHPYRHRTTLHSDAFSINTLSPFWSFYFSNPKFPSAHAWSQALKSLLMTPAICSWLFTQRTTNNINLIKNHRHLQKWKQQIRKFKCLLVR